MRYPIPLLLAGLAMAPGFAPEMAQAQSQTAQLPLCPSEDKAAQIVQSRGGYMPEDCRMATITRFDTPSGPICLLDFGQDRGGIFGELRNAVTTTKWWTACPNLRAP
jgi:hypothetical protein